MSDKMPSGERWGSKLGVIMAVAGSAVGLGNFLRFPGKAADYGGGAFMIPYFCALLLLGIPIGWVEWSIGRRGGRFGFNSAPGIFSVLWRNPLSKFLGTIGILVPVLIYVYYVYIESWCLLYAGYYLVGEFDSLGKNPYAYGEFFKQATGVNEDGAVFRHGINPIVWFFLATFAVNFIVIYRGLSGGIETFCKWAMPLLIVAALIVVGRVLTLPEQPIPEPWQKSVPAVLSSNEWERTRAKLVDPSVNVNQARVLVRAEFERFFQHPESIHRDVPFAPPAGFLKTDDGFATALAEIRDVGQGNRYREWLGKVEASLNFDEKRTLQRLERRQMRVDQAISRWRERHPDASSSQDAAIDPHLESQRVDIEAARKAIFTHHIAEPVPSLSREMRKLSIADDRIEPTQLRAAAIEVAEIPRTVNNGLGFMWNPDFSELRNPEVWLEAAGQIFFTLSVGFGIVINYSSYLRRKDDLVLSGLSASSMNEFCEVCLGGMVAIPATFIFLGTAMTLDVVAQQSSFGLGFNTLPTVFASMSGGRWFAVAWFFLLFLAGITSSLAMLQPAIAFLEEGFKLKRHASVSILGIGTLIASLLVVYYSRNLQVLDTMDYWVGTFMIYVLATIQVILFGWVLGINDGFKELESGAEMRVPRLFRFIIKYVTPAYLFIVFAAWIFHNAPARIADVVTNPVVRTTVLGMIGFWVLLLLLIVFADRNWSKEGRGAREIES
jgi:SNF family Na+-dependent transporter